MMVRSTYRLENNKLMPLGERFIPKSAMAEVIDYVVNFGEGDTLVVVKLSGSGKDTMRSGYSPTTYQCARLLPVENTETASFDNPLYKFPRAKRAEFKGEYRVEEIYLEVEPRRHSSMYRELVRMMKRLAAGRPVNWKVPNLEGVPVDVSKRTCSCCSSL